ncbi:hypothetical protein GCM10014713_57830 [Streptomyces purpureus]|uniref:Uncharacterized protein n=1 Tax=Streptomyces purpureus TaxID=1951 RepID=A0A918LVN0_9ACTN|nr:hypothetical protein GCM10014713_57830 [Streptomyces purpureus]
MALRTAPVTVPHPWALREGLHNVRTTDNVTGQTGGAGFGPDWGRVLGRDRRGATDSRVSSERGESAPNLYRVGTGKAPGKGLPVAARSASRRLFPVAPVAPGSGGSWLRRLVAAPVVPWFRA